jgi:glucose 1-dehydrogenase
LAYARLACRLLITSVNAPYPYLLPGSTAYNMAKAALEALTANLASALAKHRINCNAIRPGWILTEGERQFMQSHEIQQMAAEALPYGVGMPKDIARAAVFLASDDAAYITGIVLPVDGGLGVSQRVPHMHDAIERATS